MVHMNEKEPESEGNEKDNMYTSRTSEGIT
jgi:hypothetical protein